MHVRFYVWDHGTPPGTRSESFVLEEIDAATKSDVLTALDVLYDQSRHVFATRLSKVPGNVAFTGLPEDPRSFSHQLAVARPIPYEDVVRQMNATWLSAREGLAEFLLPRL